MLPFDDETELQRVACFIVEQWKDDQDFDLIIARGSQLMMDITRADILEVVRVYVDRQSENHTLETTHDKFP